MKSVRVQTATCFIVVYAIHAHEQLHVAHERVQSTTPFRDAVIFSNPGGRGGQDVMWWA